MWHPTPPVHVPLPSNNHCYKLDIKLPHDSTVDMIIWCGYMGLVIVIFNIFFINYKDKNTHGYNKLPSNLTLEVLERLAVLSYACSVCCELARLGELIFRKPFTRGKVGSKPGLKFFI